MSSTVVTPNASDCLELGGFEHVSMRVEQAGEERAARALDDLDTRGDRERDVRRWWCRAAAATRGDEADHQRELHRFTMST